MKKITKMPNMDIALAPRDKDGRISPMIFDGGTDGAGNPLFFPVLPPSPGGQIDPMLFEDDFSPGGRYDGKISYQAGFYPLPLGVMPDGSIRPLFVGNVTFRDPICNLPRLLTTVSAAGIPPVFQPVAQALSEALAVQGIRPAEAPPREAGWLFLEKATGKTVPVCNAALLVKRLRRIIDAQGKAFEVDLVLGKDKTLVTVPETELCRLDTFLGAKFPWFHTAAETVGAAALLEGYVRDQLKTAPCLTIFRCSGWQQFEGQRFYLHDGLPLPGDLSCECGHAIVCDPGLSPSQAFREALALLEVGSLQVTLPLFLTALLGPLFRFFEDAGQPPRFCTFVYGLSGSLKTALAEVLAGFYGSRDHSTFRDTPAAIDVNVGKHRDRVLLVDDFQPVGTAAEGRAMRKTLEHLVRLFGDDIGKNRSNSTATATRSQRPRGSCIITGESLNGSFSSLLRCLLVPIRRGDIDGTKLRRYQEQPALWTSNFVHLLPWVGANWDAIVARIRAEFPQQRQRWGDVTSEPRLSDTGAILTLAGEIFLEYGIACGAITPEDQRQHLAVWNEVITSLLIASTESSQGVDVTVLSRAAISDALMSGTLNIAPSLQRFATGCDGFYTGDRLWLFPNPFMRVLRKYCQDAQTACVLTQKSVLPELFAKGLIVRDEERGKDSFLKRTPGNIPALGTRPRMLAFVRAELSKDI